VNAALLEIPPMLDRRPVVWSYSLLNCFRNICPHQGEARYLTRTIKFVETPEIKFGNQVHTAFEHRIGGGKPLPLEMHQWEKYAAPFDGRRASVEQWFHIDTAGRACERNSSDKFGHGKLDLVCIDGATAYIGDWKTGNSKYEDPFELEVGAVLLKAKHPHLTKIVGNYIWLKDDRVSKPYDLSNTAQTWAEICSIMQTIYNYRKIGEFPKRQSPLCGWCQRFDCENNTNPQRPS